MKKAANDAAEKAKNAKESLATALTEAKNAKSKATGEEVNTWETAINELTELAKEKGPADTAASTTKTEAEAVGKATKVEDAKTAWKESAGLLKTAKEKLDTATLKKLASSGASTLEPSKRLPTPPTTDTTSKDQDKKKTAGAFGVSITAEYSKKFSLETKMHSEIKVTMVPYPPPTLFMDWVRDHFEQVKKEREAAKP